MYITRSPHAVGVFLPCYLWRQKWNRRVKSTSKFTNEWVYIIEKKQCFIYCIEISKVRVFKSDIIKEFSLSWLWSAWQCCASRLANQKRRHMFLRLWGIQTRYCAPIRRRSIYHFSWVLQPSKRKLETMLTQKFGGQKGALWEMCEWRVLFQPRFSFCLPVTHLTFRTTKEKTYQKTSAFSYFTNRWTRTQARLNGFSANDATSKKMFNEQNNKKFARASFFFCTFLCRFCPTTRCKCLIRIL